MDKQNGFQYHSNFPKKHDGLKDFIILDTGAYCARMFSIIEDSEFPTIDADVFFDNMFDAAKLAHQYRTSNGMDYILDFAGSAAYGDLIVETNTMEENQQLKIYNATLDAAIELYAFLVEFITSNGIEKIPYTIKSVTPTTMTLRKVKNVR